MPNALPPPSLNWPTRPTRVATSTALPSFPIFVHRLPPPTRTRYSPYIRPLLGSYHRLTTFTHSPESAVVTSDLFHSTPFPLYHSSLCWLCPLPPHPPQPAVVYARVPSFEVSSLLNLLVRVVAPHVVVLVSINCFIVIPPPSLSQVSYLICVHLLQYFRPVDLQPRIRWFSWSPTCHYPISLFD